jgi:hypothetical protein
MPMKSEAHTNFENLLKRVVSVPHAEVKRRMNEAQAKRDETREEKQPVPRARPIVSPAAVSSSKNRV